MILSLLSATARAQTTTDPLFEQLLGEPPVAMPVAETPAAALFLTTPQLVFSGVAILMLAALSYWLKQRQKHTPVARASLSLNSKLALPGGNAIALVQVKTANGKQRELLIGLGNSAPTLIKDLGLSSATPAKPATLSSEEPSAAPDFETLLQARVGDQPISARAESANALISDLIASRDENESGRSRWA